MEKSIYYNRLSELQDLKYRDFQSKLIPTTPPETVIGVRTPEIRKLAKVIYKEDGYRQFLEDLPHSFYDENQLHAMIINQMGDFEEAVGEVERFLPFVDNWATCDLLKPKAFKRSHKGLVEQKYIKKWLDSSHEFTIRYGIGCLMNYFLKEDFSTEYLKMVASVKSEEYYVNMMIAWYFATALAFRWDETLPYIRGDELLPWVKRKTIQKAIESYRINAEQKKTLRIIRGEL